MNRLFLQLYSSTPAIVDCHSSFSSVQLESCWDQQSLAVVRLQCISRPSSHPRRNSGPCRNPVDGNWLCTRPTHTLPCCLHWKCHGLGGNTCCPRPYWLPWWHAHKFSSGCQQVPGCTQIHTRRRRHCRSNSSLPHRSSNICTGTPWIIWQTDYFLLQERIHRLMSLSTSTLCRTVTLKDRSLHNP